MFSEKLFKALQAEILLIVLKNFPSFKLYEYNVQCIK